MAVVKLDNRIERLLRVRQELILMENRLDDGQLGKVEVQEATDSLDKCIKILKTLPRDFKG